MSNMALNVTNSVDCEHPGYPGETNRRTEERIVWGLDGQKKAEGNISGNSCRAKTKDVIQAHARVPKDVFKLL